MKVINEEYPKEIKFSCPVCGKSNITTMALIYNQHTIHLSNHFETHLVEEHTLGEIINGIKDLVMEKIRKNELS